MTDSRKIVKAYRSATSGKLAWLLLQEGRQYFITEMSSRSEHIGPYPSVDDAVAAIRFQAGEALQETMHYDDPMSFITEAWQKKILDKYFEASVLSGVLEPTNKRK